MTGRTILITGGTSGIGLATARLLATRGDRVAITGRDPERLASARRELGPGALAIRADATTLEDCEHAVAAVRQHFGELTGVFLNAGTAAMSYVGDVTETQYDHLFATNAKGPFFTLQHALPLLVDGGAVVMTVGVVVANGQPGATVAAASHGALLAMLPSLTLELAPRRIRVNAVSPGAIDTPLWSRRAGSAIDHAAIVEAVSAGIPFGRFGRPDEVGELVSFLLSDAAGYITGQHVAVAGGL